MGRKDWYLCSIDCSVLEHQICCIGPTSLDDQGPCRTSGSAKYDGVPIYQARFSGFKIRLGFMSYLHAILYCSKVFSVRSPVNEVKQVAYCRRRQEIIIN